MGQKNSNQMIEPAVNIDGSIRFLLESDLNQIPFDSISASLENLRNSLITNGTMFKR
jgi:hypothetical protein